MKRGSALLIFLALVLMFESAHAQYYAVKSDSATVRVEVPAAVVARFRKVFPVIPRDTIVRWEVSGPTKDYSFGAYVGKQGASFDAKGEVEETVLEVRMASLPKPVQRKIKKSVLKGWSAAEPNPLRAYVNTFNNEIWY